MGALLSSHQVIQFTTLDPSLMPTLVIPGELVPQADNVPIDSMIKKMQDARWVKCHFVKWVDPEWDELAAKTILYLSERNIVLQKSLDDVNKSWMSLYARKMREDDLWSRKLADARINHVNDLDKIKSIGDDLAKIKLIGLVVMVTLFYDQYAGELVVCKYEGMVTL
ncbi:hypothetical protein OsJ_28675 [Oryza sativa Japonica Group]|uniref:Uncharacterized protein n=1 Tax=Oryza sativa subsp. japonica TaxID=39947 RepID=B9G2K4_ORYSJ|nr:hypothetical protein OsJ_28675 [Oryza sativa Japonica Group]